MVKLRLVMRGKRALILLVGSFCLCIVDNMHCAQRVGVISQTEYDAGKRAYEIGNTGFGFGTNANSGWLAGQAVAQRAADQRATQERQQRETAQRTADQNNGWKWW